jgi:hypothetical protein
MKHIINRNKGIFILATLFVLPAAYCIGGSILKFEPGLPWFYNMAEPLFIKMGLNEKLGFNINLLVLFGPIVALGLSLYSLVKMKTANQHDFYSAPFFFGKQRRKVVLTMLSAKTLLF